MSTLGSVQQGFPNISLPFVDNKGIIQQAWTQLLISLWKRTGDGPGDALWVPGDIKESASTTEQSGWLICDGTAVSRSTYSDLFNAIGVTWGPGDGSNTFNLPDLRNRTVIGAGTNPVGAYGGMSSAVLSSANLPSHNHAVVDPGHIHAVTDPGHTHAVTDPGHTHTSLVTSSTNTAGAAAGSSVAGNTGTSTTGVTVNTNTTGVTVNSHTTGITTGNTGTGTPFSILPPFAAVTVLIKT